MIREVCATCAVSKIAPMGTIVSGAVAAPRSLAWLVGGFALLALTLAAAGIYGVVSHGVLRRTRELGVRLALGASPGRVAWLVVASSLRQVVVGSRGWTRGIVGTGTLDRIAALRCGGPRPVELLAAAGADHCRGAFGQPAADGPRRPHRSRKIAARRLDYPTSGSSIQTFRPGSVFSAQSLPWCRPMAREAIARPRPTPPVAV